MTRWRSSGTPARPAMIRFWSFISALNAFDITFDGRLSAARQ
jgi:hypothetical protein